MIAIQHDDLANEMFQGDVEKEHEYIFNEIKDKVILKVIPKDLLSDETKLIINGTGRFVLGGPHADAGLTGRKIIVDTYGGMGRHGGGRSVVRIPARWIDPQHMLRDGRLSMLSLVDYRKNAKFN